MQAASEFTPTTPQIPGIHGYDQIASLFTSKERDSETGLDWFDTRYFSSAQGRFTSPDAPLIGQNRSNPQSWNLYSYGLNNPLRYNDPTGHDAEEADPADDNRPGKGCQGPLINCGTTIGPLPLTSSLGQTQDRAVGAVKGLFGGLLDTAEFLGAPSQNVNEIKDFFNLWPSSQNQQFGGEIGGFVAALLPTGNSKEIQVTASSFEDARNMALKIVGDIDPATRQATVGRVGALRGEVTGFATKVEDVFKQFRIDWDPSKGAHINVTVGGTKYAVTFPASLDQVKTLLKGNIQK
jgi:RHS repeat-associated protein